MDSILEVIDNINDLLEEHVSNMTKVTPSELNMDPRSGYQLWVDEKSIVVRKRNDRSLQYYGGFEYVDKDCRTEMGEFVIYSNHDEQVQEHLDYYFNPDARED